MVDPLLSCCLFQGGHDGRVPGSLLPLTQALMTLQDRRSASPDELQRSYSQVSTGPTVANYAVQT